jgi:AAA domain
MLRLADSVARAAAAASIRPPPRRRAVRFLTPAQCAATEPRGYVVKGLLAPEDLAIIFGGPGLGKSCLAPRMAYAIARGTEFFGRRVRQGRVLYVAAEDPHGMRQRIRALREELGDTPELEMAEGLSDFMTPDGPHTAALEDRITEFGPAVLFIDTIAASFRGLKENDSGNEGMGAVVGFARDLIAAHHDLAVVLVHHVPKGDASTPRGHGMLHGDADVALSLSRSNDRTIQALMTKNRNGPSDVALCFRIRAVTLGVDEDGDAITAPVCDPIEGARTARPRLPPLPLAALRILNDLILAEGTPLPAGAGFPSESLEGVAEDRWRQECESRRLSTAGDEDSRRRVFRSAYQKLRNASAVAARDGWVWAVHASRNGSDES